MQISMNKLLELASGQITNSDRLVIVLSKPDGMPAAVIIHWPLQASAVDPRAFSAAADAAVKTFAAAVVKLAQSRRGW
jgi:hypothetical protein